MTRLMRVVKRFGSMVAALGKTVIAAGLSLCSLGAKIENFASSK